MPFDYQIHPDRQLLLGRVWGVWTIRDVNEFRERAASDPDFSVGMAELVDLTEVTDVDLTVPDAVALGRDTPLKKEARRAYVAPSPSVFRTLRAYQATADVSGAFTRVQVHG